MTQPKLYIAIGASGSGKSTLYKKLKIFNPSLNYLSWDQLRHEWYDPENYSNAWKLSNEDKSFGLKADFFFRDLLKKKQDLFIDNTNLTPKRRKAFIEPARKLGYKIIAIIFDVPLKTLIARQSTRGDKYVPEEAVMRQYNSVVLPFAGEVDEVLNANEII